MHIIIKDKRSQEERNKEETKRGVLDGFKREEQRGNLEKMSHKQRGKIKDAWETFDRDPRV